MRIICDLFQILVDRAMSQSLVPLETFDVSVINALRSLVKGDSFLQQFMLD